MLDSETKRRIDTCRDLLVGKIPDPKSQVEQITLALIYKFMDDMDRQSEELGGQPSFFTGEYTQYSWSKVMSPQERGNMLFLYSEAMAKMNENPNIPKLFRDIFKNAYLPYRDPETLREFLKEINKFQYDHSEKLGDAFEYLLSVLGSQGDAGQFRTPRHIIDFIVEVTDPKAGEVILDPACGTAGFLISAYKHILKHNSSDYQPALTHEAYHEKGVSQELVTLESPLHYKGDLLSVDQRSALAVQMKGYDISPDMVRLSLVNMYLHGFPDPKIEEYDTLTSEDKWNEYADVVLANPPFMSPKGGIKPHKKFTIDATRSEVLFVDYIMEHLRPHGRAGIIVPEGIIFQSGNAYKKLRELLVNQSLVAVVSLPAGVFNPYSGVKTSILILDKALAKQTDSILFAKVENDGYALGAQRRAIDKNDLPQMVQNIKAWKAAVSAGTDFDCSQIGNMHLVSKDKIAENGDYNLSGERYVENKTINAEYSIVSLEKLEDQEKITFLRGQGISKKDIIPYGRNKCIHYGEIYTSYDVIIKDIFSFTDLEGKILSKKGDVLIPSTTTADAMGIAVARSLNQDNIILGGDINIIRTENKYILSDYLAHLICNSPLKNKLAVYAKGTNILHLSNKDIKRLEIPLPPLDVQQQIVDEIEAYQKIIDGAKQIITAYKPHIPINPNWEMVELGEVAEVASSKRIFQEEYVNVGIPFYRTKEIVELSKGRDISLELYISKERYDEIKQRFDIPKQGDILISAVGTIGISWVISDNREFYFKDGNLLWLKNMRNIIPTFLKFILDDFFARNLNDVIAGAAYSALTIMKLRQIKIPLPPLEIQQAIVAEIEHEQSLVNANKELIRIFESKIKTAIGRVWNDNSTKQETPNTQDAA